jgi:exodeoxyribonuclease VII large subunit
MSKPEIAKKLQRPVVDLIIVARGGGSAEDLWTFNLEAVARAIIASPVPVISAIGHESDVLVSDLVADIRASTPSNAIERCVPEKNSILMWFDEIEGRLENSVLRRFGESRQHLISLTARLRLAPLAGLSKAKDKLNGMKMRINSSSQQMLSSEKSRLVRIETILQSSHPKRVLERGYSMAQTKDGEILSSVKNITSGQEITMTFADGSAFADITKIIEDDEK